MSIVGRARRVAGRLESLLESHVWAVVLIGALISIGTLVLGEVAADDTRQRVRAAQLSAQHQAATRAASAASDIFAKIGDVIVPATSPNSPLLAAARTGDQAKIDAEVRQVAGSLALRYAPEIYFVDARGVITTGYDTGVINSDLAWVIAQRGDVIRWFESPTSRLGAQFMSTQEMERNFAGPEIYLSALYVPPDRSGNLMSREDQPSMRAGEKRKGYRFSLGRRVVSSDNRLLGALVVDLYGAPFVDSVFNLQGTSRDCYLIDRNGRLVRRLQYLDPDLEMGRDLSSASTIQDILAGRTLMGEGEDPFIGGAALLTSVRTPNMTGVFNANVDTELIVVTTTPVSTVYADVESGLGVLRATRLALVLVLLVFAVLLTETLRRNVRQRAALTAANIEIAARGAELAAATRHKSEFLANMSHELRTPLNAIIGFADVLGQNFFGELNAKQAEYVGDISGSGRHLLALVNEILDLSKVEAGRMELERTDFAAAELIRSTVTFVRERAASHAIQLSVDVADDLGTANGDERKIRQVILNLLSNAVKFTPAGGTIRLTARRENGELLIAVSDTGIGIAPEDQAKVFEEFRQVGRPSDRSREGTGLGLTLAKKFIDLHGGRIWLESALGRGTTFTFALPVRQTAPVAVTA